ncbi:MAG TPA: glycosyltransferase [Actinomycetota bacterium]|nr:glycosyltransferase [Actinomycetota bacterium]
MTGSPEQRGNAHTNSTAPDEVQRLGQRRADARAAKDFAAADALRDEIAELGWAVTDAPGGFTLEPGDAGEPAPVASAASDVPSALDREPIYDVAIHWVCEGWSDDIDRAIAAFSSNAGSRKLQFVVADVTGDAADRWVGRDDVEVVWLRADTGWAAARNAGLSRSLAPIVVAVDGSIEPTGDVFSPVETALKDPAAGVVGPFGIVTHDLREFEEAADEGPCDAVEGYLMAFRREVFTDVGGFDEKFRWYRTADIDWSFRVREAGLGCSVVPLPVVKHEHRAWAAATESQRTSWSKRNFYRFLDRYRDRWDLVLSGEPEDHDHDDDHEHEHRHERPVTMPEGR